MYRDVMLALTDTDSDGNALDAAIAFATSCEASLRVAIVLNLPISGTV